MSLWNMWPGEQHEVLCSKGPWDIQTTAVPEGWIRTFCSAWKLKKAHKVLTGGLQSPSIKQAWCGTMWPPDRTARGRGLPNSHLSSCRGVKTQVNPSYTANSRARVSEDEQALSTAHKCTLLMGKGEATAHGQSRSSWVDWSHHSLVLDSEPIPPLPWTSISTHLSWAMPPTELCYCKN